MGVLFSLITAILFGLSNVYSRRASKTISGESAIVLTVGLNALFFFPFAMILKWIQGTSWPDLSTISLFLLVGIFGTFLGRWGLYNVIGLIGPSRASVIKNSSPVFSIVLAFFIFNQWPSMLSFMGICAILVGIWVTGWGKRQDGGADKEGTANKAGKAPLLDESRHRLFSFSKWQQGILLGIVVAFLFAIADIIRTLSIQRFTDIILATGFSTLGAWLAMLFYLLVKRKVISSHRNHWKSIDKNLLLASTYSGIAQLTNFLAVKMLFVPYVSALIATAPLWTALLSKIMLHNEERFGVPFWNSLCLLISGACLIIIFK